MIVMLFMWLVNVLLLMAAGSFSGGGEKLVRVLAGGLPGALAAGLGLYPGFAFLNGFPCRLLLMAAMAVITFGINRDLPAKLLAFTLLQFSLGGLSSHQSSVLSMLLSAVGISLACMLVRSRSSFVPVEFFLQGEALHLTALHDTGNTLRDPLSGEGVLVVDADTAQKLTGLTPQQLRDPVGSLGAIPGLRLIPYHTVGNSGFLLALRLPQVKIGTRQGSAVVAFAPQSLGKNYQALTGGNL